VNEGYSSTEFDTVQFCNYLPTFRRILLPQFQNKKDEDGFSLQVRVNVKQTVTRCHKLSQARGSNR
jgi:hypothetical protein